MYKGAERTFNI